MSLGGGKVHLKGDAGPVKNSNITINIDKENKPRTTYIHLYNWIQFLLVCSIVGSLWTMAMGIWWIKYYVECNYDATKC